MKILLLIATALLVQPLIAADGIRSEDIRFEKGTSGTTIKGSLSGDEVVDYKLTAKAGQTMAVELTTDRGANYFNVLPPGSGGEALFVGSMNDGKRFKGKLPADGVYTVRLYQMGNAKDSGLKATYSLEVSIAAGEPGEFERKLSLQGIDFHLATAEAADGTRSLTVTPAGLSIDNSAITIPLKGKVTNAEVGDINADVSPELYVYLELPGDDARGQLLAWSANSNNSLSEIYLPEIPTDDPKMAGYRGHDEFAVVEGVLARRFPISEPDANEVKIRQFQYKLVPGETGWILKLDRTVEF